METYSIEQFKNKFLKDENYLTVLDKNKRRVIIDLSVHNRLIVHNLFEKTLDKFIIDELFSIQVFGNLLVIGSAEHEMAYRII